MNPRKPAIAFASSSSASITSSSGAQGYEDFTLHVTVKWLIGRRCLPHQAWHRLSGVAVAILAPEEEVIEADEEEAKAMAIFLGLMAEHGGRAPVIV